MTKQQREELKKEEAENQKQFDLSEKEQIKNESPKEDAPKKSSKSKSSVIEEGITDGLNNFIKADKGQKLSDSYKETHKDWKSYKKFADGTIEF